METDYKNDMFLMNVDIEGPFLNGSIIMETVNCDFPIDNCDQLPTKHTLTDEENDDISVDDRITLIDVDIDSFSEENFVGYITGEIVELEPYSGFISKGEAISVIRKAEQNKKELYVIENKFGCPIGRIKNNLAQCLTSILVDKKLAKIRGFVTANKNASVLPIRFDIYANFIEKRKEIYAFVAEFGYHVSTKHCKISEEISDYQNINQKQLNINLCSLFERVGEYIRNDYEDSSALTETSFNSKENYVLAFMIGREMEDGLPPFWTSKPNIRGYVNSLTNSAVTEKPMPIRGGILANCHDINRILVLLNLIAGNISIKMPCIESLSSVCSEEMIFDNQPCCSKSLTDYSSTFGQKRAAITTNDIFSDFSQFLPSTHAQKQNSGPTLIVCTLVSLPVWTNALVENNLTMAENVLQYYRSNLVTGETLKRYTIVLTTYATLLRSVKDSINTLFDVDWFRVVLDDAQRVLYSNVQLSEACSQLHGERMWIFTAGSVNQNSFINFSMIFRFLQIQPLNDNGFWHILVEREMRTNTAESKKRVLQILQQLSCLRLNCKNSNNEFSNNSANDVENLKITMTNREKQKASTVSSTKMPEEIDVVNVLRQEGKELVKKCLNGEILPDEIASVFGNSCGSNNATLKVQTVLTELLDKAKDEMLAAKVKWYQRPVGYVHWQTIPTSIAIRLEKAYLDYYSGNGRNGVELYMENYNDYCSIDFPKLTVSTTLGENPTVLYDLKRHHSSDLIPPEWDYIGQSLDDEYTLILLDPQTIEYQKITENIMKTANVAIVSIHRVQNPLKYKQYCLLREKLIKSNAHRPNFEAEKQLFHGTNENNVPGICSGGFNRSLSGQHGTAYGNGSYFARDFSYSMTYGQTKIFYANVLTGVYTQGNASMRVAPNLDVKKCLKYDSVVDSMLNPSIYVVFSDNHAYPGYVITYNLIPDAIPIIPPVGVGVIPSFLSAGLNNSTHPQRVTPKAIKRLIRKKSAEKKAAGVVVNPAVGTAGQPSAAPLINTATTGTGGSTTSFLTVYQTLNNVQQSWHTMQQPALMHNQTPMAAHVVVSTVGSTSSTTNSTSTSTPQTSTNC